MEPYSEVDHFVIEMLYESSLEPVSMSKPWIKQMIVSDATRSFVEQL